MAPHSSTLAWKIPWMEEPGRLQSMELLRVGHDWAISLSRFIFMHWRRKWQPTPVFLPGESQGQGASWAAVYGVAQSRTRLKWLSSSSSSHSTFNFLRNHHTVFHSCWISFSTESAPGFQFFRILKYTNLVVTVWKAFLPGESPWTEETGGLQSMGWHRVGHD